MKLFSYTLLLFLCTHIMQAQEPSAKLNITRLTGDLYVFTTYNTYKGSQVPANGMYLVTDKGVAMFDTPWDTTQFQPLLDSIQLRHHQPVVFCVSTHSHEDRTGGLAYYRSKGIRTYTTRLTDSLCVLQHHNRAEFLMKSDTTFQLGSYHIQTFYGGPGHTPDNIVIWFEEQRALFGGCLIKSTEATDLGNLSDANVKAWPATLRKIDLKFPDRNYVIPGHQSWKNKEAIRHTIKLIRNYESKNSKGTKK